MIPYISKEFHYREKLYYWNRFNYKEANTFCRIAVVLHSEDCGDVGDELSTRFSEPHDGKHAEVVALEYIVNDLESKGLMIENDTVLDVIIRINNSPCPDCQQILFSLLMEIKKMAPNSHFRLIIFFSNLYLDGVEELAEWILELVEGDVVVILCPLFVCKMVPMPKNISKIDKSDRPIRDQKCIKSFRDLLSEIEDPGSSSIEEDPESSSIEENPGSSSIEISHELFQESSQVSKSLFSWKDPHFISIFPRNIPKQLSQLFIVPGFFKPKPIKKEIKVSKGMKRQQSSEPVKGSYSAKGTEMKSSKRVKYSEE